MYLINESVFIIVEDGEKKKSGIIGFIMKIITHIKTGIKNLLGRLKNWHRMRKENKKKSQETYDKLKGNKKNPEREERERKKKEYDKANMETMTLTIPTEEYIEAMDKLIDNLESTDIGKINEYFSKINNKTETFTIHNKDGSLQKIYTRVQSMNTIITTLESSLKKFKSETPGLKVVRKELTFMVNIITKNVKDITEFYNDIRGRIQANSNIEFVKKGESK